MNINNQATIESLHIYPLKSGYGIDQERLILDQNGLQNDRVLMLVDAEKEPHKYITQREYPELSLVSLQFIQLGLLQLSYPQRQPLQVDLHNSDGEIDIKLKQYESPAVGLGEEVSQWFSNILGKRVSLVRPNFQYPRAISDVMKDSNLQGNVGFPDNAPLHLISQSSVDHLNTLLKPEDNVHIQNFRPNIVVNSLTAFVEMQWRVVEINNALYDVRPTSRCVITTIDPDNGVKRGKEPVVTLAKQYSNQFGVYLIPQSPEAKTISLGDRIQVVE